MNIIQKSFLTFLLPKLYNSSILFTSLYLIQRQKRDSLQRRHHRFISIGILIGLELQFIFTLLLRSSLFSTWLMQNKSILQMINSSILFIGLTGLGLTMVKYNSDRKNLTDLQQYKKLNSEEVDEECKLYLNNTADSYDSAHFQIAPHLLKSSLSFNNKLMAALNLSVPVFFVFYQIVEIQCYIIKRQRLLLDQSGFYIAMTAGLYLLTAVYGFIMFTICRRYTSRFTQQVLSLIVIHFTGAIELSKLLDYFRHVFMTRPEISQSLVYTIRQSQQQSNSVLSQIWNLVFDNNGVSSSNAFSTANDAAIWTGAGYSFYWFFISLWLTYNKYKVNK